MLKNAIWHPSLCETTGRAKQSKARILVNSRLSERSSFMKAVVYKGKNTVAVEEVSDPTIEAPGDAIIRITTTA